MESLNEEIRTIRVLNWEDHWTLLW